MRTEKYSRASKGTGKYESGYCGGMHLPLYYIENLSFKNK